MEQLNPKLIIPTPGIGNMEVIEYGVEVWPDAYVVSTGQFTVGRPDLSDETKFLLVGDSLMGNASKKVFKLPEWE